MRLIITNEAKSDLRAIRRHIAEDSPKAAQDFTKDLTNKLKKLADTGITGSPRNHVREGLRGFPYRNRCFYFRVDGQKLYVVRVLHSKQDVTAQDF